MNRRGFLGLFAAAAVAPIVPALPPIPAPPIDKLDVNVLLRAMADMERRDRPLHPNCRCVIVKRIAL